MKKAFLVGVNIYQTKGSDLRGCVNDVLDIKQVLIDLYGFSMNNIRIIMDAMATKTAILDGLAWLTGGNNQGDELVFHYSGHGSQIKDRDGDESEGMDEIFCPHDMDWNNPLSDDVIYSKLNEVANGVFMTTIADCCHSGSITRALNNGHSISRYLAPPKELVPNYHRIGVNVPPKPQREVKHVLLSGCRDNETSADAFIGGKYRGALTNALTSILRARPKITWSEAYNSVASLVRSSGYNQNPQLSGPPALLSRNVFGL